MRNEGRMHWRDFILGGMVCVAAAGLKAQTPSGSLRGIVEDEQGSRIASATVTIRLNTSSFARNVRSDGQGDFRIDDLKPGTYSVNVRSHGFSDAIADVVVAVSFVRDITVTMKPPVINQTVNVQAQSSSITTQPIDLASQVHQSVVSGQDLEELPLP